MAPVSQYVPFLERKKKGKYVGSENTLHKSRKRRHISSRSRESPSPEGKREANMGQVGFWQRAAPGYRNYNEYFCFQWDVWLR